MLENISRTKNLLHARAREIKAADRRLAFARAITRHVVAKCWQNTFSSPASPPPLLTDISLGSPGNSDFFLGSRFADEVSRLDTILSSYLVGCLYTALIPRDMRGEFGVYYTPPAISRHLMELAEQAGTDWGSARVLDPACGGGAFLAPLARRMLQTLEGKNTEDKVKQITKRLAGLEIDPFAAWLSQVFLEIVFREDCPDFSGYLPTLVQIQDTLQESPQSSFDLVIGNPPYGRVRLSKQGREKFKNSLYGHANLYGLFTDQALSFVKPGGQVAFITPTSFLAGQYFKNLRKLLGQKAPPVSFAFISARNNVFENVLQETMLAVYHRAGNEVQGSVQVLDAAGPEQLKVFPVGTFQLPPDPSEPWPLPRTQNQGRLLRRTCSIPTRLRDLGFKVSTGPLVWNRHKPQLRDEPGPGHYPLIWAESVSADGSFCFRAEKRGHKPYFEIVSPRDNWLAIDRPCVLLQRTTAKEQKRRLIAAELPAAFLQKHGKAVVENHLNMIVPVNDEPGLSPRTIAALMNSRIMDQIFRCINGSVAVSAYELEALPLPPHQELMRIEDMIQSGATNEHIENEIERFYATSPAYPASKRSTTACRSSIRREFRTGTIASGRYRPERSLS
jgi:adenine-specific DNA-methyltransferase